MRNFRWYSMGLSIWPPPRRPLTRLSYLPLVLFVVLYPVTCWLLEAADEVVFTNLWSFALLLLAPWLWRMHVGGYSGLSRGRALAALYSRFALLALFIALLAEPRAVRRDEHLSVMFVIDHSASIVNSATDGALAFVMAVTNSKPEKDEAGLLFFGKNAAVELPPGLSLPYEAINVHINRDGTDIAKALSLAAAMLPPRTQSRIVLISDGVTTQGALAPVLDDLASRKIPVDVLPVDYSFEEEVWLERLDLPRFVKIGQPFDASVVMSSLKAGEGTLTLEQNGEVIARQKVSFHAGKNRFSLPVHLRTSGYYEYSAQLEVPEGRDSWKNNNRAISFLYLQGKGSILLVTDDLGNEEDWRDLSRELSNGSRKVERINAFDLPSTSMALLPYDCIIFVNVARDAFHAAQLQAVHDAVYIQGSGFLMVGGPNSYGPGGYQRTVIEKVLPVSMDVTKRKVLPKGALAIVLHTCEFADGNTWGKRITKQAIQVLSARDEIGVLVYDYSGGVKWLFALTEVGNFRKLATAINNAQIGDMPDFATTMRMGLKGLLNSDAAIKHMIIISDGDPSPPPPPLLRKFRDAKISISTIAMFPHGPNCLPQIAAVTGGRYYAPTDPNQLPRIFIKEAKTLRRSAIQERTFVPEVTAPSAILKGIARLPKLDGYVWTTPKPRSTTILDGPEKDEPDPVLAVWRYGVGASAAFTSDLSSRWAKDWVTWHNYSAFVRQLLTEISRAQTRTTVQVRSYAAGGRGHIVVEDFDKNAAFLSIVAQVDGPQGSTQKLLLRQVAPNRYENSFPLNGKGRYQVTAVGVDDAGKDRVRAHGGFVVSYSAEYLRFRADPVVLDRIRERTGGRRLVGTENGQQLFDVERVPRLSSRSIVDLLLLLLACLIPLDVALRRVQLDWVMIRAWFGRGSKESTKTLGALLAMKERLKERETVREADDTPPGPEVITDRPAAQATSEPGQTRTITKPVAKPTAKSTTSRLLEAKRRAQRKK